MHTLEQVTAVAWLIIHLSGSVLLYLGWRRFKQRFFVWSCAKWACQAFGGIARDLLPDGPIERVGIVCVRVAVATTGVVALYYTWKMLRAVTGHQVVGIVGGKTLLVRRGFEASSMRATSDPKIPTADERDTLRPPPPDTLNGFTECTSTDDPSPNDSTRSPAG